MVTEVLFYAIHDSYTILSKIAIARSSSREYGCEEVPASSVSGILI